MTTIDGSAVSTTAETTFNESVSDLIGCEVAVYDGIHHKAAMRTLTTAQEKCRELEDEELSLLLVTYLTAHYYAAANGTVASKSVNGVSKSYTRPGAGLNLRSTPYGQQATLLDPCGVLEKVGYRTAAVRYVGPTLRGVENVE